MRVDFCGSLRFRPNTECALGVFLRVKSEKCVSDSKQLVLSKGGETNKTETATTRAQSRRITSTLRLEVARSEIEVSAFGPLPLRVVSPFAYLALKLLLCVPELNAGESRMQVSNVGSYISPPLLPSAFSLSILALCLLLFQDQKKFLPAHLAKPRYARFKSPPRHFEIDQNTTLYETKPARAQFPLALWHTTWHMVCNMA